MLEHIAQCANIKDEEYFLRLLAESSIETGEKIMSFTQHITSKAREEGLRSGHTQGLEQGLEQGLKQGERRATLKIASELLASGMDVIMVAKFTGLHIDSLLVLKSSLTESQ